MKKLTLWDRASRAVSKCGLPRRLWLAGYAAGVRDARKRNAALLKDAERRVREAEAFAAEHYEHRRIAVDEANRRAAIIQSRLPANNGGYG